jgi:hypothetical protein
MAKQKTANAVDSGIKTTIIEKPVFIERRVKCQTIADELASRITGKLIGFDDLFDAKTNRFLTESELQAKGAVFVSVSMNKPMVGKSDIVKKSRKTGEPTPYISKTVKYIILGNLNWGSYINKRGHGDFIPDEKRANGVTNYAECRAIGTTTAGNKTINGVVFHVVESTKYFDESGNEYPDKKQLEAEYLKTSSPESRQNEADKHGIDVRFDPQYRTTRIDSCDYIRCFGFEYRPTENHKNQ